MTILLSAESGKNAGITGIPAFSSIYVEEAQPAGDSSSCLTVMEDTL